MTKLRARLKVEAADGEPFDDAGIDDLVGQWTTFDGRPAQVVQANLLKRGDLHLTLEYER
jgi:hypothetical protein